MSKAKKTDTELQRFMDDLEQSIQQAQHGENGGTHVPEQTPSRQNDRSAPNQSKEP